MKQIKTIMLAALAVGAIPVVAHAQVVVPANPDPVSFNGHTYQVIIDPGIGWDDANDAAQLMTFEGKQGHLATITSFEEDEFIDGLRQGTPGINLSGGIAESQLWVGGFQAADSQEPGGGWEWVNNEGAIPTPQSPISGKYSNWRAGEPNDAGGNERHLAIGWGNLFVWNDGGGAENYAMYGYVVEFDGVGTVPAETCRSSTGGCNPTGVMESEIPDSADLGPDDTWTQSIEEIITDPRVDANGQCTDRRPLDVFGDGSLILPEFLCGSPEFAVIVSDASFDILKDVLRFEQYPERLFASTFECGGALGDTDLQRRAVFAWQATNRTNVLEGRALELTLGCGSSRGSTREPSFFLLNLHIDCGIQFGSDDAGVLQCFKDLTADKFDSLDTELTAAKKGLQDYPYGKLRSSFVLARNWFDQALYGEAVAELDRFISRVESVNFDTSGGFNHQGNLLMRAYNLRFMIDEKIGPASP